MRGTSSPCDKLTGDFGNAIEIIRIGDYFPFRLFAKNLWPCNFRVLQQNRPIPAAATMPTHGRCRVISAASFRASPILWSVTWAAPEACRPPMRSTRPGPRMGSPFGLVQRHMPYEALRGNKNIMYDPFRFIWLGSLNSEVSVTMVWANTPHRRAEDLLTTPLIMGSLGQETDSETETNAMIKLMRAPMQIIRGYSGTAQNLLALEKGEIQGLHGVSWSYVKARRADWLRDGKIRILLQTGLEPHPDLKSVPTIYDLVKSDDIRQI